MTIMKQLIETMIHGYLEESYEDDLIESIFEEVSAETWEAIEEAILNELSPELMARYAQDASGDYMRRYAPDSRKGGIDTALKKIGAGKGTRDQVQKRLQRAKDNFRKSADSSDAKGELNKKGQRALGSVRTSIELAAGKRDMKDLSPEEFKKKYRKTKSDWFKDTRRDSADQGRATDRDS